MPHLHSPAALAARRLRAECLGFLRRRPEGHKYVAVEAHLASKAKDMISSLQVHAHHNALAARPAHFARHGSRSRLRRHFCYSSCISDVLPQEGKQGKTQLGRVDGGGSARLRPMAWRTFCSHAAVSANLRGRSVGCLPPGVHAEQFYPRAAPCSCCRARASLRFHREAKQGTTAAAARSCDADEGTAAAAARSCEADG